MKKILPLAAGLSLALLSTNFAQELQGTSVLFQRLTEISKSPADSLAASPAETLRRDVKKFRAEAAVLKPEEAATLWLSFVDRYTGLRREEIYGLTEQSKGALDFQFLVSALPPPTSWAALAKATDARPATSGAKGFVNQLLRLVAHTLLNDSAARWQDVKALHVIMKNERPKRLHYEWPNFLTAFLQIDRDPKHALTFFEEELASREKRADPSAQSNPLSPNVPEMPANRLPYLVIPDLLSLTDEASAIPLLKRALLLPEGNSIAGVQGEATKKLILKLALEMSGQLPSPPWAVVDSLDAIPLIEAMERRFPANKDSGEQLLRNSAENWYLLGLIVADRTPEALKLAEALGAQNNGSGFAFSETQNAFIRSGHPLAIFHFLSDLLTRHPEFIGYWRDLLSLAPQIGKTDEALSHLRTALARQDLPGPMKMELHDFLAPALLEADQIEEGVKELQTIVEAPLPPDANAELGRSAVPDPSRHSFRCSAADQIARIGELMKRQEWIDAGLTPARRLREEVRKVGQSTSDFSQLLIEFGQGQEAEQWLIEEVIANSHPKNGDDSFQKGNLRKALSQLLYLYHHAGRADDVLALLDQATGWGVEDVGDILAGEVPYGTSPTLIAATALAAKGRTEEARRLVLAELDQHGDNDSTYKLLLKLGGNEIVSHLDALTARNRFEARPLIWKAQIELEAGTLDAAEQTVRAAIAIDPSDGEQPKGDRMRAYAILASILEKKGDPAQAQILRGAVEAIRLSETADDWWQAGLVRRAAKMYQEALTHFSDAYCIQSRLALRYAELGLTDQAAEHFRRAYELMPDSFGRVESHCFGCEGTFASERAQAIAETVFTTLAAQPGAKPQVHYLLGILREEQGRPKEALESYLRAVALDPDYLNAWKKIADLGNSVRVFNAQIDDAVLNQIRLDPLCRQGWSSSNNVANLQALWAALTAAEKLQSPAPRPLYSLAASKVENERERAANVKAVFNPMLYSRNQDASMAGKGIAENAIISAVGLILDSLEAD